ncbi:MAG: molybdopterin-dependent oxidoreductase [Deltaproteobacteria bacterium]|nr:molybdopterin-dependent oxidoreductase [Deltaproteobacteria bacterium]
MAKNKIIGQPFTRVDGRRKACGSAVYGPDIKMPGLLHAKFLGSIYPHAKILHIDTEKAGKLSGVKGIITHKNVPEVYWGLMVKDTPILTGDKVRFIGEPLAVVAATDPDIAEEAAELINVEYEELEPVFDPEEALEPGAPLIHEGAEAYACTMPDIIRYGNVCGHTKMFGGDLEQGWRESDVIFEDRFSTPVQHHGFIEPHAATARFDLNGRLEMWTSTQAIFATRVTLGEILGLPLNQIRVIGTEVGGGFGGKVDVTVEHFCALLAKITGKPIQMNLTRAEDMTYTSARHSCVIYLKTGVKKDGHIVAREARLLFDTGGYAGHGPGVAPLGGNSILGPYRTPHFKIDSLSIYTNKMNFSFMRAPGGIQASFACESHIDRIARELNYDPFDFRMKNLVAEGDTSATGQNLEAVGIKETLLSVGRMSKWKQRKKKKNHGWGLCCFQYEIVGMPSSALVKLNEDGSIHLLVGAIDLGQGSSTVLTQVLAEEMGVAADQIAITVGDTDLAPYDTGTYGDRVTFNMGNAVIEAARDLKSQLFAEAATMLEIPAENLEFTGHMIRDRDNPKKAISLEDLAMNSYYVQGGAPMGKSTFFAPFPVYAYEKVEGNPYASSPAHTYACQVVEISVDKETGVIKVEAIYSSHDVGQTINPLGVEGQIQGGIMMGLGYALWEEVVFDAGRVINPNLTDYKMPFAINQPEIRIDIIETKAGNGPYGAKGAGNPPILLPGAAMANALYDAVGARIRELPLTPEKVLSCLKNTGGQKKKF